MKKIILTLQFLIIAVALWSIKNYKIINIFTEYIDFIIWVWYTIYRKVGNVMVKNISGFFTDTGNVSVKVRNSLKAEMLKEVKGKLSIGYEKVILGKDGAYYIQIGEANKTPIYARLELTISVKSPQSE